MCAQTDYKDTWNDENIFLHVGRKKERERKRVHDLKSYYHDNIKYNLIPMDDPFAIFIVQK